MFLDKNTFSIVIENTPLISIDLIVKNNNSKILLGKRVNEPALDYWFVPGGRILKNESLDLAFTRTVKEELGLDAKRRDAKLQGTYEHFYDNNVFDNSFSTHYIVLAHKMEVDTLPILYEQHSEYKWFEVEELLRSENVHKYTKDYFR